MKMELKVTGWGEDPLAVAQAAMEAAVGAGMEGGTGSVSFGNAQGVAVVPEVGEPVVPEVGEPVVEEQEQEQAAEMAVNFASYKSARLADELNVPASAFDGVMPSGVRGFTVGDVRALAES